MGKIRCLVTLLFSMIFLSTIVLASPQYHLTLLAVQEHNNTYTGSTADLYLELKEGTGRVFLDTYPFTKADTQVSTRFAKEIACKHYKLDCDQYDFIYTIKAKSVIVGGPSAGAAIAALTTIAMLDLKYDENVAITGTINSGATIGPVGGIKEKLEAAANFGLQKVLISKGSSKIKQEAEGNETKEEPTSAENETTDEIEIISEKKEVEKGAEKKNETETFDLVKYAQENLSLDVFEVMDLDEVMFHLTSKDLNGADIEIEENPQYQAIMAGLQDQLCSRAEKMEQEILAEGISFNSTTLDWLSEKRGKSDNSTAAGDYYSAASYCFGMNIFLKNHFYEQKEVSVSLLNKQALDLQKKTALLEEKLGTQEIKTISDLQTLMIVKERLDDVKEQLKKFNDSESRSEKISLLAYAEERHYTVLSWMEFFAMDGQKLVLDEEMLQKTCLDKISEAEERQQYAEIFVGNYITQGIKVKIDSADSAFAEKEYELCLIKAIQAKGEANAILSSMGLSKESFLDFINGKIKAVERVIGDNSAEGKFPILGYSYLNYAKSLKEQEEFTSLIYLEYALEMSDLGIYFPEEKVFLEKVIDRINVNKSLLVIEGIIIGIVLTLLFFWSRKYLKNRAKIRKKKKSEQKNFKNF
ncbi:MAG: hypothetical protein KKA62_03860 [Nanoarchaeota archaeon]|nr:hypothetical protein [Nanoarchaeota archaeon]MBU1643790.1 hypothetical protein [Nanoarchaeota archaeon]MBU1977061.1 hypothetical protein [Nanoarchaeota archaeon]